MKLNKFILLLITFTSFSLLGVGAYLQFQLDMAPCPLCILQRYAFALTGLICLITFFITKKSTRLGSTFAMIASLSGAIIAARHLWIKAHPTVSCGIDPLETSLNKIISAKLLPFLFQADGLCTTEYDPILGLSIPQWSVIWFVIFFLALSFIVIRKSD
jgi:disulfide bond formation protein DsbB